MCVTNCSLQIRKQQFNFIYKHLVLFIKKRNQKINNSYISLLITNIDLNFKRHDLYLLGENSINFPARNIFVITNQFFTCKLPLTCNGVAN